MVLDIFIGVCALVLCVFAFTLGRYIQRLKDNITGLGNSVKELQDELSLGNEDEESAIVDISPKAIEKREHDSNYKRPDPDDSAVIKMKTRGELEKEKEAALDKLVGQYK